MNCDTVREALSARLDGEREPVPSARVDEHLASCSSCQDWHAMVQRQNEQLRGLASGGVSLVAPPNGARLRGRAERLQVGWRRWTLAVIGLAQVGLALTQAVGADVGLGGHGAMMSGHLLNESTAWSVALGVVMILAALRPTAAAGLAGVLVVFTGVLGVYVVHDAIAGMVTAERMLSHVPVLLGTALALLVWRDAGKPQPGPVGASTVASGDIVLPDNASRGRRRGHLWPTDGTAA